MPLLALVALMVALAEHGAWARLPGAPDLLTALLAWAVIDGDEARLPLRALLIGAVGDLCDPGSAGFHLGTAAVIALLAVPLRAILFRARAAAWLVGGLLAWLLIAVVDTVVSGPGDRWSTWGLVSALGTSVMAAGWGWLLGGLPARWRPVPPAGA